MSISGAIGLTVLLFNFQKESKYTLCTTNCNKQKCKIFLFYDDHSVDNYCENSNIFISDLLLNIVNEIKCKDYNILVEEPFKRDKNLHYLWAKSEHLQKFLDAYFKIQTSCNMYSVDIRNSLVHCSLNALIMGLTNYNISFYSFIYPILYFYNIENNENENNKNTIFCDNLDEIKNLFYGYINQMNEHCRNGMTKIIDELKNTIKNFTNKYKIYYNIVIKDCLDMKQYTMTEVLVKGFPFTTQEMPWTHEFNLIIDTTMELFTLAILLSNLKKINIIYMGFAHCSTLSHYLKTFFECDVDRISGLTDIDVGSITNVNSMPNSRSCVVMK